MVNRVLTLAEVQERIEHAMEERELTKEQNLTLQHCTDFTRLDAATSRELVDKLLEIERLQEAHKVKLTDLLPASKEEVLAIFAKERFALEDDEIARILDIVAEYR